MKNFLFSLIFVLLAGSLWAQQQTDVLQQMEHRMYNDPIMEQHASPDQGRILSGEMDFLMQNMQNIETDIQVDSVYHVRDAHAFKETYTYDDNGNRLTYLQLYWSGGFLTGNTLYTYTYDENGNNLTSLHQTWEFETWVNGSLATYTYDDNGNMLTSLYQVWENKLWVNSSLNTYNYDTNGNRLTYLRQDWKNNAWENNRTFTYTYDADGNRLTYLRQEWENDVWENTWLQTYTYDTDGNLLTDFREKWVNNSWRNDWYLTYTYDENKNIISYLGQYHWMSDEWTHTTMVTNTYDQNSNKLMTLWQNGENGFLVNKGLNYYTYNDNGNRLTGIRYSWKNDGWIKEEYNEYHFLSCEVNAISYDWDGSDWIQGHGGSLYVIMGGKDLGLYSATMLEFYYTDFSGIDDPQSNPKNSPILCYPNPVTDQINIEIDPTLQAKNYHLELFSQTGQKVKSFEISSNIGSSIAPITVDDVPAGLYLLRIEIGKQNFSQKIIISK
jgi:hypothetical protein